MNNNDTMKAVLHTKYGPPDELRVADVPRPVPADDEVLVRIHASTLTSSDCNSRNMTFVPGVFRLPARLFMFGVFKPRKQILGIDFSGEVEAVGKNVKNFKAGDHVFGTPEMLLGCHAEYICIKEKMAIVHKPENVDWGEAAAIPLAGNTALYFIRDLGNIQPGQKVLINGASGGVGTFAVQLAKYYGAEVTGVCSTGNVELVKSLGADRVIDYTKIDFTLSNVIYDVVFDVVGKITFSRCKDVIREKGLYMQCLIDVPDMLQALLHTVKKDRQIKSGVAVANAENLNFLKELVEVGDVKPVIDKSFPLEQVPDAYRYVEQGHKKGNVVITI